MFRYTPNVDCRPERHEYPDDMLIVDNTLFTTERECWEHIVSEAKANMRLAARGVTQANEQLSVATQWAANAAIRFAETEEAFEEWNAAQPKGYTK